MIVQQAASTVRLSLRHRGWQWLEWLVYLLVALLIVVRFFTERIPLLPRFLNAVDLLAVPLLLPLSVLWIILSGKTVVAGSKVIGLSFLFVIAWLTSWIINNAEVHWLGAVLLVSGLLAPILFYLILINIGLDRGFCERVIRLLFILLVANLLIGSMQAIENIDATNSDFVFGTFGLNQNQLAFFLAIMIGYMLARWRYQGLGIIAKLILLWTGVIFLLCGFQTLWLILAMAYVIVFFALAEFSVRLLLGRFSKRILVIGVTSTVVVILTLSSLNFGRFEVLPVLREFVSRFDRLGKVQLVKSVPEVWQLRPWSFWVGTGPGTFNSRAFRSIAIVPYGNDGSTDVAASVIAPFYTSELSARFIVSYFQRGIFFLSGANTDGPFTSYVSVPIETGLFGASFLFGIYGLEVWYLVWSLRRSTDAQQRTLAAWALINIFMLLGIAFVDNYLETTRYTLMVWLSVAIWHIYSRERRVPQLT